jgi:hypothetical protein
MMLFVGGGRRRLKVSVRLVGWFDATREVFFSERRSLSVVVQYFREAGAPIVRETANELRWRRKVLKLDVVGPDLHLGLGVSVHVVRLCRVTKREKMAVWCRESGVATRKLPWGEGRKKCGRNRCNAMATEEGKAGMTGAGGK